MEVLLPALMEQLGHGVQMIEQRAGGAGNDVRITRNGGPQRKAQVMLIWAFLRMFSVLPLRCRRCFRCSRAGAYRLIGG